MDPRTLLDQPLTSLKAWVRAHERLLAVNLSWTLAIGFMLFSVWKLLRSLGIL